MTFTLNAARPTKPTEAYGSIHMIDGIIPTLVLNWNASQYQETVINFYDITLISNRGNSSIHAAALSSMQTQYVMTYIALDGNYTSASITAVDLCGQRSEPSKFELPIVINTDNSLPCNSAVSSLTPALVLLTVTIVGLVCSTSIIPILCIACRRKRKATVDLQDSEHKNKELYKA